MSEGNSHCSNLFLLCNNNVFCHTLQARRLENEVKDILDDIGQDDDLKKELLQGRQVDLAEELSEWFNSI